MLEWLTWFKVKFIGFLWLLYIAVYMAVVMVQAVFLATTTTIIAIPIHWLQAWAMHVASVDNYYTKLLGALHDEFNS